MTNLSWITRFVMQWQGRSSTFNFISQFAIGLVIAYGMVVVRVSLALFIISNMGLWYGCAFIFVSLTLMNLIISYPKFKIEEKILRKGGRL